MPAPIIVLGAAAIARMAATVVLRAKAAKTPASANKILVNGARNINKASGSPAGKDVGMAAIRKAYGSPAGKSVGRADLGKKLDRQKAAFDSKPVKRDAMAAKQKATAKAKYNARGPKPDPRVAAMKKPVKPVKPSNYKTTGAGINMKKFRMLKD
jgi:hypothetical protein